MLNLIMALAMSGTIYSKSAVVTDIIHERDCHTIELTDKSGNVWMYESEDGDIDLGDEMALTMYDNETKTIYDDIIVSVRYEG